MCSFDESHKVSRLPNLTEYLNPESGYVNLDNGCSDLDPDMGYLDPNGGCLDLVSGYLKLHNGHLGLCFSCLCVMPLGECTGFRA